MAIERLDLRNSGDTAGPHDRVVGYGSWALFEGARTDGRSEAEHDTAVASAAPTILALATGSIRAGLATGAGSAWDAAGDLPPLLREKGAAFVTLKRRGALRGCIGSAEAWRPLGEDILDNALKAAFRDPRFPPLVADEVAGLEVKVAVLSPPVPVAAADEAALLAALRPGRDGLIIEDDGKRALFLPSVWTELRDPRQFLLQLKRKAGMADDHWSPRFRARRFHTAEVGTSRDGAPGPDHDAAAMLRPTPA
jgi:AmmeMemoRadiSam system protein A